MPSKLESAISNSSAQVIAKSLKGKIQFDDAASFFPIATKNFEIDPKAWNQLLPYRFMLLETSKGSSTKDKPSYNILTSGSKIRDANPIYTLPIAPQNISIQMPFASQTTILSDGILVENNGAPIRTITISGTTGVLPYRPIGAPSYDSSIAGQLVGNSARSVRNIAGAGKAIGSAFKDPTGQSLDPWIENSGYAQFHKLSEFLQLYAEIAKNPQNKQIRLAFDMAKDNTTYLVTPKMFSLVRSADSPLEYKYTIQLEAWKRINVGGYQKESVPDSLKKGVFEAIGKIQKVIDVVKKVADVINQAINLIGSVIADVKRLVNIVREIILLAKSIAGAVIALIDLPNQLLSAVKGPILGALNEVKAAWEAIPDHAKQYYGKKDAATISAVAASKIQSVTSKAQSQFATQQASSTAAGTTNAGNPSTINPGPNGGATAPQSEEASLLDTILKDPISGSAFMAAINLDQLNIPSNLQEKIDAEIERVKNLTRQDFQERRDYVNQISRDLSVAFGLGDSTYDSSRGYVGVVYPPSTRKPSRAELDVLFALKKFSTVLNDLSTFEINGDNSINESFNFIGQLASSANINLNKAQGKKAVPVPYGASIQDIANIYTGSPDNVTEIVLLNGLLPPYIDEDGIFDNLITNGNLNSFNVANGGLLFLGQKIILSSNTVVPFARNIIDIKKINNFNYLITVDGDNNLNTLTTTGLAKIQFFQRGTVSSRDAIFVPSTLNPSEVPERLRPLPFYFQDIDKLAQFTGVDIALGSNNDVIMSRNGQVGLTGGLANLQQALKIKFLTPKGSLLRHPNFGFGVLPGTPVSEIDINSLKNSINELIGSDERFAEVQSMQINIAGPVLQISGGVTVSENNRILPFGLTISP